MFESIRIQLMEWAQKRRQIELNVPDHQIIVSHVAKTITELTLWQAHHYHLVAANDTVYEVFLLEHAKNYIFKLEYMTCTCFQWQSVGIPCSHAINGILQR